MTVKIDTDAEINSIRLKDQGSNPSAPSDGYKSLFVTTDDLYMETASGTVRQLTAPKMVLYSWDGILYVTTGTSRIYNQLGRIFTFQEVFLSVGKASTDASIIVDINKNGTSIFSSRPTIVAGSITGSSASFSVTTWNPGDYLTADIDQIGSGTAGSSLVAHIIIKQSG